MGIEPADRLTVETEELPDIDIEPPPSPDLPDVPEEPGESPEDLPEDDEDDRIYHPIYALANVAALSA